MPDRLTVLARLLLLALAMLSSACATPIGVRRVDPQTAQRSLTSFVLSSGELSGATRIVINRLGLAERYENDPAGAIADLHARVSTGRGQVEDQLFALVELCFLHGEKTGTQSYSLASALYAYALLFPEGAAEPLDPLDPRLRHAADLHNHALAAALAAKHGDKIEPRAGVFALPFGELHVVFDPESLRWHGRELGDFVPMAEYEIFGLRNRYRRPGIGGALAAGLRLDVNESGFQLAPRAKVPVTAFLRIDDPRRQLAGQVLRATLELRVLAEGEWVTLGGARVPLELESSAVLAYQLHRSPIWDVELKGFFLGDRLKSAPTQLFALEPYRRGRFPVVFVHGTASSPARCEMLNELQNDRDIRSRFQFWFFAYDTGNPPVYSALVLREALGDAVQKLDPEGTDKALSAMVVIGHSQGGLLTKMIAIDPGTRLWDGFSKKPIDELNLSAQARDLLQRGLFIKAVPTVRRVVFMATPHHGSYRAGNWATDMITRFLKLPRNLASTIADAKKNSEVLAFKTTGVRFTSVNAMTPGSQFVKTLTPVPIALGVASHSIIAVSGQGAREDDGDGVVKYTSAHLDGVDSELVVRSGHSVQSNPEAIEEVRRILLLHAREHCESVGCAEPPTRERPTTETRP